ncbi:MAG: hypothetical protein B6I32_07880 [Desulfobacterium sp. 4572_20]|nr:MAG: hypothetical protein B6I32_07880 [Desulfobacterium sp. 4572_20]
MATKDLGHKTDIFYSPTKIIFGSGSVRDLPQEIKSLGKKALIVTDSFIAKTKIIKEIMKTIQGAGVETGLYDGVLPEPPLESVDNGVEVAVEGGYDVIVGVGGGSSLDVAKGIAIVATNGGKVIDYVGIVTADTGMDALVHAIETYVAVSATEFSDPLAEKAISLIAKYLPIAAVKSDNAEARYYMSLAATLAGLAFASGGLGAVHALSYPLGTEFHMSHGRSNAIMLPYVMEYNLPGNFERYAGIAELMGEMAEDLSDADAAFKAVEAIKGLLTNVGVPQNLRDYGIKEEDLPKLVEGGMNQARLFVPNPRNLTKEDVEKIFAMAF